MISAQNISPSVLAQMRDWIADCWWPDLDPSEVAELSDAAVLGAIRRHFDGGITEFLKTCEVAA